MQPCSITHALALPSGIQRIVFLVSDHADPNHVVGCRRAVFETDLPARNEPVARIELAICRKYPNSGQPVPE